MDSCSSNLWCSRVNCNSPSSKFKSYRSISFPLQSFGYLAPSLGISDIYFINYFMCTQITYICIYTYTCIYTQTPFFLFVLRKVVFFFFNWSIFDLQCCVNFCCTAKWLSYTYTYTFSYFIYTLFHYGSSLCYTVGPVVYPFYI